MRQNVYVMFLQMNISTKHGTLIYTLLPSFNDEFLPWAAISDHNSKGFKESTSAPSGRGQVSGPRAVSAMRVFC